MAVRSLSAPLEWNSRKEGLTGFWRRSGVRAVLRKCVLYTLRATVLDDKFRLMQAE